MNDTRSEFEKSLDPSYNPGKTGIIEKPEVTAVDMERGLDIDHHSRPLTVTFRTRYHALECWSVLKKTLEVFEVDQKTQGVMMEAMSTLAEVIDADVTIECKEKGIIQPEVNEEEVTHSLDCTTPEEASSES